MVQSFQSLMLMSSSNTRAQNTVTFKSFTKAYCLLLDATDIWEYKYKWHPRPHSDDAILPKSNADDGLPPHWRERRLKIYHACPSPTSPHTKLSSCCINSNWNKKLMVLLEFSVNRSTFTVTSMIIIELGAQSGECRHVEWEETLTDRCFRLKGTPWGGGGVFTI